MKQYLMLPAKVSIAFYTRPDWVSGLRKVQCELIKVLEKTTIHHCGIMINRGEDTVILAADKYHRVKFLDQEPYHQKVMKPFCVVEVGECEVSLIQLADFLKEPYLGDAKSLVFWYFIGRHFLPRLTPKTCAVISCYMLRLCGFHYPNYVSPKDLYHALIKKGCEVKSWEEYAMENNLRS
jgi:hypothetical protein